MEETAKPADAACKANIRFAPTHLPGVEWLRLPRRFPLDAFRAVR
jgi:hypothetical protein